MQPPFPSPVPTWHNDTYASISPKRTELTSSGRTVVITGAGGVIGRESAIAFAVAGARRLVLIGRTVPTLKQTEEAVEVIGKDVDCLVFKADVTDIEAMNNIAAEIGTWDVLILNAGHLSNPGPIASADIPDYWAAYEINVKSVLVAATVFLPIANKEHAIMLGITAGALVFPPQVTPGLSAYLVSKIAAAKTLEYLAAENPNLFVASVHPGMIESKIFNKSGAKAEELPMDSADLAAHFILWMSSPEASFLRGKFVWANWDVDELKAMGPDLAKASTMTVGVEGWPFGDTEYAKKGGELSKPSR